MRKLLAMCSLVVSLFSHDFLKKFSSYMCAALMQAWFLDGRTLIFVKPHKHWQGGVSLVS